MSMMKGSMWRHLAPHNAPRLWQRRAIVGRDRFCYWAAAGGADPKGWCMAMMAWLMVSLYVGLVVWMQGSARLL